MIFRHTDTPTLPLPTGRQAPPKSGEEHDWC